MPSEARSDGLSRNETAAAAPVAQLQADGSAVVHDQTGASQLHGRGGYGTIGEAGKLNLDPLETAYLCEMQRLKVEDLERSARDFRGLLAAAHGRDPTFEIRYLVYRDLRQRGYVVLRGPPPVEFSLLPRGGTPAKTASKWWVESRSERVPFSLSEILDHLRQVRSARRTLLLGIIDEESDLTYYRVREVTPQGENRPPSEPAAAEGVDLGDRVSLFDSASVEALDKVEHYGSRVGSRLELSLLEALYLESERRISLYAADGSGTLDVTRFERGARATEPDLPLRLPVYRHLRAQGLIPKTGFKYGTHFRAYERDPSSTHARYLVHVVPPEWSAPWPEVARAVRLAQGVRKQLLFASMAAGSDAPTYLHLERMRP